jgi:PHD/YefM family antitoxin component YafN of YafNO toxin-antitoxin module
LSLRQTMIEITQDEFESNFDSYMDRVEKNQELFLVRLPDGRGVVMAPVDEETFDNVTEKNYVPEITD